MPHNQWTLSALVFALACAPETSPDDGVSSTSVSLKPDTLTVGPAPGLPADEGAITASHMATELPNLGHPTAEGGPLSVLRCASEARQWGSMEVETFLFEAERSEDGLEVHMARLPVHGDGADPSIEVEQTLTTYTWDAERVFMAVQDEYTTSVEVHAVEGTDGHLFTGGGHHFCFSMNFVCWDDQLESRFTYDAELGACTDETGRKGLNPWPIEMVRETGDAECADLRGVALEEGNYGYPVLADWNLRGAVLDDASIHFAKLEGASLEGADLSGLTMGYANIDGSIDRFTRLPEAFCDSSSDDTVSCIQ